MKLNEIDKEILSMSTEDLNGLWEPLWYFNSKLIDSNKHEIRNLVFESIQNLLKENLISIHRYDPSLCLEESIEQQEIDSTLQDPANWEPPIDGTVKYIRFISTSRGEQVYYSKKT
jgi:hypothetical protein